MGKRSLALLVASLLVFSVSASVFEIEYPRGTVQAASPGGWSLSQSLAGEYPWVPLGPADIYGSLNSSGKVSALAVDWSNASIMYAGSGYGPSFSGPNGDGGVFKTVDGGTTWTREDYGLADAHVNSLLLNASDPNEVLAGTITGGIYRTSDGGAHWVKTASNLMVFGFAAGGGVVYAPTYDGVLESHDFGLTWKLVLPTSSPVYSVTATSDGAHAYAMTWDGVLYGTSDTGASWSEVHAFTGVQLAWSLSVVPDNPSVLYFAYSDFANSSSSTLWKSVDGGSHWTSYPQFVLSSGDVARSVAFGAPDGSLVYLVGQGFADVSVNGGATFTSMSLGTDNRVVWTDPTGTYVYVGSDQGLYLTSDAGARWSCISASMGSSLLAGVWVAPGGQQIEVSVQDYATIYSQDGGGTWLTNYPCLCEWPGEDVAMAVNPANTALVYSDGGGAIKYSTTGGSGWVHALDIGPNWWNTPQEIAVDPQNPSTVLAGSAAGVYRSDDWGETWSLVTGSPANVGDMVFAPGSNTTVYVGTNDGFGIWNLTSNHLDVTLGASPVTSIAVDPSNPKVIFAASGFFSSGRVYESVNGGATFKTLTGVQPNDGFIRGEGYTSYYAVPITQLAFVGTGASPTLVAATTNGLFYSSDLGSSWHSLQYNIVPSTLTGVAADGNDLYVSTWGEGVLVFRNFDPAALPGTLDGTLPAGTRMLVNGNRTGLQGGFSLVLPPGTYNVTLTGTSKLSELVQLSPGSTVQLKLPAPATTTTTQTSSSETTPSTTTSRSSTASRTTTTSSSATATSTATTGSSSSTSVASVSTTVQTSSPESTSKSGGVPMFPMQPIALGALTLLVVGAYALARRRVRGARVATS